MKLPDWNFEDFIYGFAIGQVTAFVIGGWSLAIGMITGTFFWWAGQGFLGTKLWRIVGIPLVVSLVFCHHRFFVMSGILQGLAMTQGWSIPDVNEPKASPIGTFWWNRLQPNRTLTEIVVKVTWFMILGVAMIPLFF